MQNDLMGCCASRVLPADHRAELTAARLSLLELHDALLMANYAVSRLS